MDWIEGHVLAVVAPWMAGDDLATATDHHLIDIAAQSDIAVAVSDREGIVVGLVVHKSLRTDPPARLVTGIEGGGRKVGHSLKIPVQLRPDRLAVPPQDARLSLASLIFEPDVEPIPRCKALHRHHEVATRIPHDHRDAE